MRRSAWFLLGALVAGALGIAAPRYETTLARESITIHVGDTLVPHYAVQTDNILSVGPGRVIAKSCGTSKFYLRPWKLRPATHDSIAVGGDSITVNVTAPCTAPVETPVPPTPVPTPTPTPTPPPSTSSCGSHPNEPSGFAPLLCQTFDSAASATMQPGSNLSNYSIQTDAASPEGSQKVGQLFFHAGANAGDAPGGVYPRTVPFASRPTSLYVSFWVELSNPWQSPIQSGANKIIYVWTTETGGKLAAAIEFLAFGFDPTEQLLQPAPDLEGIIGVTPGNIGALPVNQVPYDSTSQAHVRGAWGHYEVVMKMNTPGTYDGDYKWWWNGRLYGDYSGRVRWTDAAGVTFSNAYWEPTYGGSTIGPAFDQSMRMKNLYVSGK